MLLDREIYIDSICSTLSTVIVCYCQLNIYHFCKVILKPSFLIDYNLDYNLDFFP